jgi:cytochrome P450
MKKTRRGLPPGPPLPRAVQLMGWLPRPLPFLERCRARYGDVFTMHVSRVDRWVVICHPDDVKRIYQTSPDDILAGEITAEMLGPIVGPNSTLVLDGDIHMRHRKLMLPPFHGERLNGYSDMTVEATRNAIEQWPVGKPFSLWPHMRLITLEIISRAVFGDAEPERRKHVQGLLGSWLDRLGEPRMMAVLVFRGAKALERHRRVRAVVEPVNQAVIEEVSRRRDAPDLDQRDDILSMLMQAHYEDGSQPTDEDLHDEVKTLLVAGHETTAAALAWTFEHLMRDEQALARVREEALAGEDDAYLDAVIKETLRLHPVIPSSVRRLVAPMELGGHTLPAGTSLFVSLHLIHQRDEIYPEPQKFRPERFLEQAPGTYTWVPFGGGRRRCIGGAFSPFEMKKVIKTVLAETELRPASRKPEHTIRHSITLVPSKGASVVMSERRRRPAAADTPGAGVPVETSA